MSNFDEVTRKGTEDECLTKSVADPRGDSVMPEINGFKYFKNYSVPVRERRFIKTSQQYGNLGDKFITS